MDFNYFFKELKDHLSSLKIDNIRDCDLLAFGAYLKLDTMQALTNLGKNHEITARLLKRDIGDFVDTTVTDIKNELSPHVERLIRYELKSQIDPRELANDTPIYTQKDLDRLKRSWEVSQRHTEEYKFSGGL